MLDAWAPKQHPNKSFFQDIRCWASPSLDPNDDGVSLLTETLLDGVPRRFGGTIGIPMGSESHARMPLNTYHSVYNVQGVKAVEWGRT